MCLPSVTVIGQGVKIPEDLRQDSVPILVQMRCHGVQRGRQQSPGLLLKLSIEPRLKPPLSLLGSPICSRIFTFLKLVMRSCIATICLQFISPQIQRFTPDQSTLKQIGIIHENEWHWVLLKQDTLLQRLR